MYKPNKLSEGYNIMWESSRIMLPEHVEALHELAREEKKQPKPFIDEQEWEEFSQLINEAIHYNKKIIVTKWDDGHFYDVAGYVNNVDFQLKRIRINIDEIDVDFVRFDEIVNVSLE